MKKIKAWTEYLNKMIYILTRRQKALGVFFVLLAIIGAVLNTLGIYLISPIVNAMINEDNFMKGNIVKYISDLFHIYSFKDIFSFLCITVVSVYLLKTMVSIFQLWYSNKFAFKVNRELAETVLKSYMYRKYDFFLGYGTAQIIRDVKDDTFSVYHILTCFSNLLTEFLTVILIVGYIVVTDWKMAITICVLAIICLGLMYKVFKPLVINSGKEFRIRGAENQKVLLEAIEGIKEVQVMKKQNFFVNRFHDTYLEYQKTSMVQQIAVNSPTYVIEGLFVIGMMAYICVRVNIDNGFGEHLPVLASFLVGAIRLMPSMGRISNSVNNITYALPMLDSVYNNIVLIKKSKEHGNTIEDLGKNIIFEESLTLKDVCWKYENADKEVLHGLNLYIQKGKSIGIIGQSGAGKSTLADIILGLHILEKGKIYLDGKDISGIPFEYSRVIGYVPQTVYLVDGTIRENVAFGIEEKDIDDNKIWDAIKQAQLSEFVKGLENGLDTVVGERGVKFSGGQRQRLAVARALYRDPQILILDEATSALDNETESALMSEIEGLYGKLTMIIIAHRLTTVKKCDVIYEIANGKAYERDKDGLFE